MDFLFLALKSLLCTCWQETMEGINLFRKAIQGNEDKLVDLIDVDSGLWIVLQSKNVLTERQIRNCQTGVCRY